MVLALAARERRFLGTSRTSALLRLGFGGFPAEGWTGFCGALLGAKKIQAALQAEVVGGATP